MEYILKKSSRVFSWDDRKLIRRGCTSGAPEYPVDRFDQKDQAVAVLGYRTTRIERDADTGEITVTEFILYNDKGEGIRSRMEIELWETGSDTLLGVYRSWPDAEAAQDAYDGESSTRMEFVFFE